MQRFISTLALAAAAISTQVLASETSQHQLQANHLNSLNQTHASRKLKVCVPENHVKLWKNPDTKLNYFDCIVVDGTIPGVPYVGMWTMLNAYRAGGDENVHWRTVPEGGDTSDCLENWLYYEKNGEDLVQPDRIAKTTKLNSHNGLPWCPLKVYRHGGKEGKQWQSCVCA